MQRTVTVLAVLLTATSGIAAPHLRVSENRRYLVEEDGKPFFYLGDTAWELFHRCDRKEAERYLTDRAKKGYTVIQAVCLAELDGLGTPNPYGHRPLIGNDPTRPDVKDGPDNDYWDHVDFIVQKAKELGLVIGMLPTWGDKWNKKWGVGPEVFTPKNAEIYGEWLGKRYRDGKIIWILGGDRPIENDRHRQIVSAMARGVRKGDGGRHLRTFHPTGGQGSAQYFHSAEWLDFNMRQNGHTLEYTDRYSKTAEDYERKPVKPVLDGEPVYEDHPVSFNPKAFGHSNAADVRRPLYWGLFSGAFGHTYGNHAIWQMWQPGRKPVNFPLMPWHEALAAPGAGQMVHGRSLIESRPVLTRIPDRSLIAPDDPPTSVPGTGTRSMVATRDESGSYAFIYSPAGRPFRVRTEKLTGKKLKAWWYDPRTGKATSLGEMPKREVERFVPPDPGEHIDWVLVLDDASRGYPPPGQLKR